MAILNYGKWKKTNEAGATLTADNSATADSILSGESPVKVGSSGQSVSSIQSKLKQLGFYMGEPNGSFDRPTYDSILKFQRAKGIKQDGVVGPQTYSSLFGIKNDKTSANAVSPKDLFVYLTSKMGVDHALGILANVKRESNFDPAAIGDSGTSGGLFQHHASRFMDMKRSIGSGEAWKTDWKGQVDFALSEKAGQQYVNTAFDDAAEASEWWTRNFERPANMNTEVSTRKNSIAAVVQQILGKV